MRCVNRGVAPTHDGCFSGMGGCDQNNALYVAGMFNQCGFHHSMDMDNALSITHASVFHSGHSRINRVASIEYSPSFVRHRVENRIGLTATHSILTLGVDAPFMPGVQRTIDAVSMEMLWRAMTARYV